MTNAEAIEILSRPFDMKNVSQDILEAHKMAISALEKQEGKKPTHEASICKCFTCPTCKNVIDHFEEFVPGKKREYYISIATFAVREFCGRSDEHGTD